MASPALREAEAGEGPPMENLEIPRHRNAGSSYDNLNASCEAGNNGSHRAEAGGTGVAPPGMCRQQRVAAVAGM